MARGGAVGYSYPIKTICMSIRKEFICKGANQEKSKIFLLVPTVVVAINIDGTTIHRSLRINVRSRLYPN